MSHNYIWLFPMAGVLIGFALSSAFLRLKPAFAKGYTRSNYGLIESNDLKLGLLFTVYGLVLIMLCSAGYSLYLGFKNATAESYILVDSKKRTIIDITTIKIPETLDNRNKFSESLIPEISKAPTFGKPKPVEVDPGDDEGFLTQRQLGDDLSAQALVNIDTVKGPIKFVKNDALPEKGEYLELSRHPELIKSVKPVYPSICIAAQAEGRVYLNLLLDYDGHIMKVEIVRSSGNPALDEAAVAASGQFIFSPALSSSGRAVRVWLAYPITFTLGK